MENTKSVDLQQELLIQVDGSEEKDHTISWDVLRELGDATQKLINSLAKATSQGNLSTEQTQLTFVGFFSGSAIPAWRIEPQPNLFPLKDEINALNEDFNSLIESIAHGNFQQIADKYQNTPKLRNEIIDSVYKFSNSVGTRPMSVVKRVGRKGSTFKPIAKIRKMSPSQKITLTVVLPDKEEKGQDHGTVEAVGKFRLKTTSKGRTSKKSLNIVRDSMATISLRLKEFEINGRKYLLNSELLFTMEQDTKSTSIDNQLLDIYAVGKNIEEAKQDLYEQFDYTYRRLSEIEDIQLSDHLINAKRFINLIVQSVKEQS